MKRGMNTSFDAVIYRNRKLQDKDNSFSFNEFYFFAYIRRITAQILP